MAPHLAPQAGLREPSRRDRRNRAPFSAGWSFLLLWAALAVPAAAASPELLGDLRTVGYPPEWAGSSPRPMVVFGADRDRMLVVAEDARHGREPWVSDGTAAGTRLLADLCPGACGSFPDTALALGDLLVFGARDASGSWLWASDGTDAGTVHLAEGSPTAVAALDDSAFAVLDRPTPDGRNRRELWATDGTPQGTRKVLDLCDGDDCWWYPSPLVAVSGTLYFAAQRTATGLELWRSDGTAAGSRLVADVCPGPCDSFPDLLTPFAGRLFYFVDGPMGPALWATDVSGSTVQRIASLGKPVRSPTATAGLLYFLVGEHDIWVSDGTPAGTHARISSTPPVDWVQAVGETILFAYEFEGGHRLSRIEPTAVGFDLTALVSGLTAAPSPPVGAGREIFFVATDDVHGRELWTTRGTEATTFPVSDIPPGELLSSGPYGWLAPIGDRVLFPAIDREHGDELWVSDGTREGTRLVRDLDRPERSSNPRSFSIEGSRVVFVADGDGVEGGLWRTDGTAGSIELLDDTAVWRRTLAVAGRVFAFGDAQEALAVVDGDVVRQLASFGENRAQETAILGDRLFVGTFGSGQELWVSDGTEEGTRLVVDVNPDWFEGCVFSPCPPIRGLPDQLTPVGDRLFFVAQSPGAEAPELWTSDGSAGGTHRVAAAEGLAVGTGLATVSGKLVLVASTPEHGSELWVTDGSAAGTRRLTDLPSDAAPGKVVTAGGGALFTVRDATFHDELWRTDGTAAGTVRVTDLRRAGVRSRVDRLLPAGGPADGAYLVVDNRALGRELWTSDGTADGTGPVADLHPGARGSNPEPLGVVAGRLLFAAAGDAAGYELWITDGTAAGTHRLTDLAPGPAASDPSAVAVVGERLVFAAADGEHGVEPWAVDLPAAGAETPPPPPAGAAPLTSDEVPGFRVWVRITTGGVEPILGTRFEPCIPETLCVSGRLPDRAEVFVRIVGPKPNGRLWPTLVKFTTSTAEIWIEQIRTGEIRYYRLEGARPGFDELPGLFDREGFAPPA